MFPWITALAITALLGSLWRLYTYSKRHKTVKTMVVITADSQASIEWWIRSFGFWSWIYGHPYRCVCFDLGSTDDTVRILNRLAGTYGWLEVKRYGLVDRGLPVAELMTDDPALGLPLVLDLRQPEYARIHSLATDV